MVLHFKVFQRAINIGALIISRYHEFFHQFVIVSIFFTDFTSNNFEKVQLQFENVMNNIKWVTCPTCKEKFFKKATSNVTCLHSQNLCPLYSAQNDMDPMNVPPELEGMTYVEEQLIAKVHPLISVFKLKGHHQYGYKGNIINFPQNVKQFAKQLPHNINDLTSIITVRTCSDVNPIDFHVRAGISVVATKFLYFKTRYSILPINFFQVKFVQLYFG